MRKLTRTALATTAVAGLLALPVMSAGAADTNVNVTLNSVPGTVSITAPETTGTSTVDLGDLNTGAQVGASLANALGTVTVADTTTGLVRASVVSVESALTGGVIGLCQGTVDAGAVTCSGDANTSILEANVGYSFGTPTTSGLGATGAVVAPVNGPLGAATTKLTFTGATPGTYSMSWSPTFSATLLGTELEGEYYGVIRHTVTGTTVGL